MTVQDFDRTLDDLTSALGDPTRRGIYVTVRESAEPSTATRIAAAFDIHSNVARHHLDRLVVEGYLETTEGARGSGAGRPAKGYIATDKEILVSYPARRYDLLAELLVRVVERLSPEDGPRAAEEIGRQYGRELAAQIGLPTEEGFEDALKAVSRAMMGVGFQITTEADERTLLTNHCPFGKTAANHPEVVCKLDQGIVRGLLDAAGAADDPVMVTPHDTPMRPASPRCRAGLFGSFASTRTPQRGAR